MEKAQSPPVADSSIRELLQDRLSDPERAALEAWISAQLDNERQGWKNKLQMAMKEIEKERRLALEVHEAIHQLNDKLEQHSPALNLYREPSMYYSSDKDMKVSHILTLGKNVDSLLTLVEKTLDEKAEFLQSLSSLEQESADATSGDTDGLESEMIQKGSLAKFSRELLTLREELQRVSKTADESEDRLTKEIDVLTESVQLQEKLLEDEKRAHLKQVETLQGIITSQVHARGDAPKSDILNGYHNVPHIRPAMRECCIQTDMDMVQASADTHEGNRGLQLPSISPNDKAGSASVSSVTELPSVQENGLGSSIASNTSSVSSSLNLKPNTHHTRADLSHSVDSQDFEQKHAIENLRNQVVNFAEKLEKARGKMNEYEKQMSMIRTSPRGKRPIGVPASQRKSDMAGVALHRKWKSSEGYLCGVRKDVAENGSTESDTLNDKRKTMKDRAMNGHHTTGTNTCFRCHKLYRTKENHRLACRFHPKSRQKIERYDNTGKLIKIVQVWECCMQRDDAMGCSVGEHI